MKKDRIFLESISEEIENIEDFIKGLSYEEFSKERIKQYSTFKALENIGEAAKRISENLKRRYSYIRWKDIAGLRDKLIHNYLGIRIETVWKTIKENIPALKEQINKILKEIR